MSDLLAGTTPGPWRFVPRHIEEGEAAVRAPEGWLICTTSSDANAKLLAAAPTLATENAALRSLCAELVGALKAWDAWEGRLLEHEPAWSSMEDITIPSALFDDYLAGPQMLRAFALSRSKELLP